MSEVKRSNTSHNYYRFVACYVWLDHACHSLCRQRGRYTTQHGAVLASGSDTKQLRYVAATAQPVLRVNLLLSTVGLPRTSCCQSTTRCKAGLEYRGIQRPRMYTARVWQRPRCVIILLKQPSCRMTRRHLARAVADAHRTESTQPNASSRAGPTYMRSRLVRRASVATTATHRKARLLHPSTSKTCSAEFSNCSRAFYVSTVGV